MGYKKLTFKGTFWMSGAKLIARSISFLKIAILAHILSPVQFGVFGIAMIVMALLDILTETGINIFLLQSEKNIKEYLNSAWLVSILRGIFISMLIVVSVPFVVHFFAIPDAVNMLLLVSLIPLIKGFINPAEIKFQKDLTFHKEFVFRLSIFIVEAIVSVVICVLTLSVYGLILGLVAGAIIELILSFLVVKPIPKFIFRKDQIQEILSKGKWVTAYGIFNYLSTIGDKFVVGRLLGASSLGLYEMASKISIQPGSEFSDVISRVTFPVYAKIANDKQRLFNAFFKTILLAACSSLIVGIAVLSFSEEIVLIAFGKEWLQMLPTLKVLIIYGVISSITGPSTALFLAVKKQRYIAAITLIRFVVLAITIYPLVMMYGLIGAAYSVVASVVFDIPIGLYFMYKIFNRPHS